MIRLLTYLLWAFSPLLAAAQVTVSGVVVDKGNNESLAGASVMIKGIVSVDHSANSNHSDEITSDLIETDYK